jgi:hypothetical protein
MESTSISIILNVTSVLTSLWLKWLVFSNWTKNYLVSIVIEIIVKKNNEIDLIHSSVIIS